MPNLSENFNIMSGNLTKSKNRANFVKFSGI